MELQLKGTINGVDLSHTIDVDLSTNEFSIGRSENNSYAFPSNVKFVSRVQFILKKKENKYIITDKSRNGTFVNRKRLAHDETIELKNGDVISMNASISFVVRLPNENLKRGSSTLDSPFKVGEGQEEEKNEGESAHSKKLKLDKAEDLSEEKDKIIVVKDNDKTSAEINEKIENVDEAECQTGFEDDRKDEKKRTCKIEKQTSSVKESTVKNDEDIMSCIICQELLYDCVSVMPCLHVFCGGCISLWLERNNTCPQCRVTINRASRFHFLRDCIEMYLKTHPERERSDEDKKHLDSLNTIGNDKIITDEKVPSPASPDSSGSSSSSSNTNALPESHAASGVSYYPAALKPSRCRQCPGARPDSLMDVPGCSKSKLYKFRVRMKLYTGKYPNSGTRLKILASSLTEFSIDESLLKEQLKDTGDEDEEDSFSCSNDQVHTLCQCCLQLFPKRSSDVQPIVSCSICYNSFCHAYWGCKKAGCNGCIGRLKDLKFQTSALDKIILNNGFESNILKNYLEQENKSVEELWLELMEILGNGVLTLNRSLCGRDITRRPNCWYGSECRTQGHNVPHAKAYNHVCSRSK
ncbi:DgyrCDS5900 [Dimorphilus gyrociliatus]|uniref:E3 ubiquitin-protein ligase CHFR n=1 Tax=Dimorphilus gyrociliatus TaxID=2664684 RepID=A0A7I8VNR1_9ANNE|nr:DgyrCDS5900 [Dimorphilus gyrociliatus]